MEAGRESHQRPSLPAVAAEAGHRASPEPANLLHLESPAIPSGLQIPQARLVPSAPQVRWGREDQLLPSAPWARACRPVREVPETYTTPQ